MVGKSKPHTKEDTRRFQLLQQIGCFPCRMRGLGLNQGDIHHILKNGKRQSHQETICLCVYHHRGIPPTGLTDKKALEIMGPSLEKNKKSFYKEFGTEEDLLEYTNKALKIIEESII